MEKKEYQIGGKTFIQRPLVLGQLKQIVELVAGLRIPAESDAAGVAAILAEGDLLSRGLAILLCEPGKGLKDKDLDALAEFMAENADFETTLGVVEDFFELTRPESVFAKLTALGAKIRAKTEGSAPSSASSPEGTS